MNSHSSFVVFLFVFLFWSASAKPCGSWNFYQGCNHDIILTHPVEEEIILVTFVEDGSSADTGENPVQSDYIPTDADGIDDKQSGEIVESVANNGFSAIAKSDPLPSNKTQEVPQKTYNTTEAITDEEVGVTTAESVTEE